MVRKAGVIADDNSRVLAKHYKLFPSGTRFHVLKSNPVRIYCVFFLVVNSISEQINSFRRHSSVCVCDIVYVCVVLCVHVLARVEDEYIPHYFKANTWQHSCDDDV